eukprot:9558199-Alexandrium_andersonii.AAC.1
MQTQATEGQLEMQMRSRVRPPTHNLLLSFARLLIVRACCADWQGSKLCAEVLFGAACASLFFGARPGLRQ